LFREPEAMDCSLLLALDPDVHSKSAAGHILVDGFFKLDQVFFSPVKLQIIGR
jgi:hypothetical protein